MFSTNGNIGEKNKSKKNDKNISELVSKFFIKIIKKNRLSINTVINIVTNFFVLRFLIFLVIKKLAKTLNIPTMPINKPISSKLKFATSLNHTGMYTVFKLTKKNTAEYKNIIL